MAREEDKKENQHQFRMHHTAQWIALGFLGVYSTYWFLMFLLSSPDVIKSILAKGVSREETTRQIELLLAVCPTVYMSRSGPTLP